MLTFKVLHGIALEYLGRLVRVADLPGRQALRCADTYRLVEPPFKLSTIGRPIFPVVRSSRMEYIYSLPADITLEPSLTRCRPSVKD